MIFSSRPTCDCSSVSLLKNQTRNPGIKRGKVKIVVFKNNKLCIQTMHRRAISPPSWSCKCNVQLWKCENPQLNGWESGIVKFVWKYEDTGRTLWDTLYRKPISHNQTTYHPQSVPYIIWYPDKWQVRVFLSLFWTFFKYIILTFFSSKYWECVEGCSKSYIWASELIWS